MLTLEIWSPVPSLHEAKCVGVLISRMSLYLPVGLSKARQHNSQPFLCLACQLCTSVINSSPCICLAFLFLLLILPLSVLHFPDPAAIRTCFLLCVVLVTVAQIGRSCFFMCDIESSSDNVAPLETKVTVAISALRLHFIDFAEKSLTFPGQALWSPVACPACQCLVCPCGPSLVRSHRIAASHHHSFCVCVCVCSSVC